MNLRSTSLARQAQVWGIAAAASLLFYLIMVFAFDDGTAWWAFWRATRMRYLLPIAVLYGFVAYETRMDWDKAGECPKNDDLTPPSEEPVVRERIVEGKVRLDDEFLNRLRRFVDDRIAAHEPAGGGVRIRTFHPQGMEECDESLSPEELWARAEALGRGEVPDPELDDEHLSLVYAAAGAGHVPALVRLGEYAFQREAYVEAYFWVKTAQCRVILFDDDPDAEKVISDFLREIRKAWTLEECPDEDENVYPEFSPLRGNLARAMLCHDSGTDRVGAKEFVRCMAMRGSADAMLFMQGIDAPRRRIR